MSGASSDVATDLYVEWVYGETEFASLRAAWNALADTIQSHSIFLRHEWFDAAWQWRKLDSSLALLCVRQNENLVGVAPLLRTRRQRRGVPVRCLEFLAVPDTQFCDILVAPHQATAVCTAIANALVNARPRWDVMDLNRLTQSSIAHQILPAQLSANAVTQRLEVNDVNLYIDLTGSWEGFYARRSRRLKKANNLVANRLQRAFKQIQVEWINDTDRSPDSVTAAAEAAIALSSQSWKTRTGLSLDQPGPGAFFRRLVAHAHHTGWLSIWLLSLDRTPAAMELQIVYRGQVHALRADFAETFKLLSPGTYLNWKLLESLFALGLKRYWFGPGENSYKLHWTDIGEQLHTLTAYNRTVRGHWLAYYETTVRPRLKKLLR